jgi:hypothetical protein
MATVVFRCPVTGFKVQGLVADDMMSDAAGFYYVSIECTACTRSHLVNPVNGKVLGGDSENKK